MTHKDTCDIYCYNEAKVNHLQDELQHHDFTHTSILFKVLADVNRAKIAFALSLEDELCVCDIANSIHASVATASHHLRSLHKQGIVTYRKEGKLAFYTLQNEKIKQLINLALSPEEVSIHV